MIADPVPSWLEVAVTVVAVAGIAKVEFAFHAPRVSAVAEPTWDVPTKNRTTAPGPAVPWSVHALFVVV
jgi:hypothetical protein